MCAWFAHAAAAASLLLASCEKTPTNSPEAAEDPSGLGEPRGTPEDDEEVEGADGDATTKAPPVQRLLEIEGGLTADAINAVKRKHLREIEGCFNQAFEDASDDQDFKGAVVISFIVTEAGTVSGAKVELSEFGFQPTELCLATVVDSFKLPKQKKPSTVHLPFYANEF